MSASGFLDAVGFTPASVGTGDFVVSAAVTGFQTPASAGAVNATVYSYRAESADKTQWENGFGAYTSSSTTLARSTVVESSTGLKVNFTSPPNVYVTALSADLTFLGGGTGAVRRMLNAKAGDFVSVVDYGADPTGTNNSTAAFSSALAVGGNIWVPPGTYKINASSLTVSVAGTRLIGAGQYSTTITTASASGDMIDISTNYVVIDGMTFTRSVTPTSGSAINTGNFTEFSWLNNLYISNQFVGLFLGATGYSWATNINIIGNYSHGLDMANNTGIGGSGCQWQLDNITSENNNGWGFVVATVSGAGSMGLGEWSRLSTFANNSGGMLVQGSSGNPVQAIRMTNCLFGQDGGSSFYCDSYAGTANNPHNFVLVFTELAGTGPCGVGNSTPVTNTGSGFIFTANNGTVRLTNCVANGHSDAGIITLALVTELTASSLTSNGQYTGSGSRAGIDAFGGRISIRGGTISGQVVGVLLNAGTDYHLIEGVDVRSNTSAAITNNSGGTHCVIRDNFGYNPVGVTAAATMGPSPYTYTAGPAPETHYIKQSGTNTATIAKGGQIICALVQPSTYYQIDLGPNEAYTCTWATTAPTYTKDVH